MGFVQDPAFQVRHQDIQHPGRLGEDEILPVPGLEHDVAAAVMIHMTKAVLVVFDGQHGASVLEPKFHTTDFIASGRYIVVDIDAFLRVGGRGVAAGGGTAAEHQIAALHVEAAHGLRVRGFVYQIVLGIVEGNIGDGLPPVFQNSGGIGGEHHEALFVIAQEADVRSTSSGFGPAVGIGDGDPGDVLALRGNGVIDAAVGQHHRIAVHGPQQEVVASGAAGEFLNNATGIADFKNQTALHVHKQQILGKAGGEVVQHGLGGGRRDKVVELKLHLVGGEVAEGTQNVAFVTVVTVVGVLIDGLDVADLAAVFRNRVVNRLDIGGCRDGDGFLGLAVDFVVLIQGHDIQHVQIPGAGYFRGKGRQTAVVSVHGLFGQKVAVSVQNPVADLTEVEVVLKPVGSVVVVDEPVIGTAQLPAGIADGQFLCQVLHIVFRSFLVGFLQRAVPKSQLRHREQPGGGSGNAQQGGRAEENGDEFYKYTVPQLFSSFHFVALTPDHL